MHPRRLVNEMQRHSILLATIVLTASACTPGPAVELALEVLPIPFVADTQGTLFVLDSGAPRTLLNPFVVPGVEASRADVPERWSFRGFERASAEAIVAEFVPPRTPARFGGLIGMDLLTARDLTLDPRGHRAFLGSWAVDERTADTVALDPTARVAFELRGPGQTCLAEDLCYTWPEARIVVPLTLAGESTHAIVDTGHQFSRMTPSLLARVEDHHALTRLDYAEGPAADEGLVFLRADLELADTLLSERVIVSRRDDASFAKLQVETGVRVEVLLGQSWFREFVTHFDWRASRMVLHPYASPDPAQPTEWLGLGFEMEADGSCFVIRNLIADSSAEGAGLTVGDCLLTIDGATPVDRSVAEVVEAWRQTEIGTSVPVQVRREGGHFGVQLLIEDLLPTDDPGDSWVR